MEARGQTVTHVAGPQASGEFPGGRGLPVLSSSGKAVHSNEVLRPLAARRPGGLASCVAGAGTKGGDSSRTVYCLHESVWIITCRGARVQKRVQPIETSRAERGCQTPGWRKCLPNKSRLCSGIWSLSAPLNLLRLLFLFSLIFILYWSVADLPCCVSFGIEQSESVIHMYLFLFRFFSQID